MDREGVRVDGTAIRVEDGGEGNVGAGAREEPMSVEVIPTGPLLVGLLLVLAFNDEGDVVRSCLGTSLAPSEVSLIGR